MYACMSSRSILWQDTSLGSESTVSLVSEIQQNVAR